MGTIETGCACCDGICGCGCHMEGCDYTVRIEWCYADTDLVVESEWNNPKRWTKYSQRGDVTLFEYCPDCGEKLDLEEENDAT